MSPVLAFPRFPKLGRVFAYLGAPVLVMTAQWPADVDFAEVIKTPAAIQAALERCDGDPVFETAFSNWLESAPLRSPDQRDAIRNTSLRLLQDTTDRQLVLGLIDGLLRHAVEDLKNDVTSDPTKMASKLYGDIVKAVKNHKSKPSDLALLADSLLQDGIISNQRQTGFVGVFVKLAEFQGVRSATAARWRPDILPPPQYQSRRSR